MQQMLLLQVFFCISLQIITADKSTVSEDSERKYCLY